MSQTKLLEVAELTVNIGASRIVKGVSLEVGAGEILGLVGASGSGKSMTALGIMRLLPPAASSTGVVRLNGETLSEKTQPQMRAIRGRDIGMVFQEPRSALNPLIRIGDQVAETVRLHRDITAAQARAAAREALDLVGLQGEQGSLDRYPYELSGGQRQRVAIAMAVVLSPQLLIADEPTTALDVITQAQVLALLQQLVRARNLGMVLVTHDLAVVAQLADRVAVMRSGEIIEQAATADILRRPQQPYTAALLAAARLQPKRAVASAPSAPAVLEVRGIVREYPRKRTSLWHAPCRCARSIRSPCRCAPAKRSAWWASPDPANPVCSGSSSRSNRRRAGRVSLLGEPFSSSGGADLNRLRRAIQVVFQDPFGSFDPRWTVARLIGEAFFLMNSPPSAAQRRHKIAAALEQVGLSAGDALRLPREFSGGERQRIAIARALITEPAVIAFDEAVSALDVLIRAQILSLLADLAQRLEVAYLFVSHDLHVIRAIADRIYVMQSGRIVEEGLTEEVFAMPRHAYTQALIAATPELPLH